jgi:homoserine O-succinyltransferase
MAADGALPIPSRPLAPRAPSDALGPLLDIALVNNMSDGALAATDRQFSALLNRRPGEPRVRLHRFHLPSTPRGPGAQAWLNRRYRDVAELYPMRMDGLIVTGSEPKEADLSREVFWPDIQRVCDWAQTHTASTLWSCLAAHAAVLHLSGVTRTPLSRKLSGVFTRTLGSAKAGRLGLTEHSSVPHSRHNTLNTAALQRHGYELLSLIDGGDADVFIRDGESLQVFLQGHPEYAADSLGLEYERDFRRFLDGRFDAPPPPPAGYFAPDIEAALDALSQRVSEMDREDTLAKCIALARQRPDPVWSPSARGLYGGWLDAMAARKTAAP